MSDVDETPPRPPKVTAGQVMLAIALVFAVGFALGFVLGRTA